MAVERQAVNTQLGRVQQSRRSGRTVDTSVQAQASPVSDNGARIAESLVKLAGTGNALFQGQLKKRIEEDQVTQTYRAIQGLTPTDKATVAGKRSYDAVQSRNQVLDLNDQLVQQLQMNPDMDDAEFEQLQRDTYGPLLSKYEGDTQMMEFLGSEMQRSQGTIHQFRMKAQQEFQEVRNQDAFQGSLNTYKDAAGSPQELLSAINGDLMDEGFSLRIGEAKQRNMLIQQATADASNGDSRLLNALQGAEWAAGDTRLKTAQNQFENWQSQEYAGAIGAQMSAIESAWEGGTASWAQTQAAIEATNRRFPGTFTASRVASIRSAGLKAQKENAALSGLLRGSFNAMTDQTAPKLGLQGLDDKQTNAVIGAYTKQLDSVGQQLVSSGQLSAEQLPQWKLQQQVQWSKANQVTIPALKNTLETLTYVDPDQFNVEGGMPAYMTSAMNVMDIMDPGTLAMYGNEKTAAFYVNYRQYRASEGDASAFERAWKNTYQPNTLTQKQRSDVADSIESHVKDASPGWIARGWARLTGSEAAPTPTGEEQRIQDEIEQGVKRMAESGASDVQAATDFVAQQWFENNTRLPNGTYVNGRADQFAPVMGVKPADVAPAFQSYLEANKEELAAGHGPDEMSMGDVRFVYRPASRSFVIKDNLGTTLTDPIRLEDIGSSYLSAKANKAISNGEADREQTTEDRQRAKAYLEDYNFQP